MNPLLRGRNERSSWVFYENVPPQQLNSSRSNQIYLHYKMQEKVSTQNYFQAVTLSIYDETSFIKSSLSSVPNFRQITVLVFNQFESAYS